ncbi:MAG: alpha/beta fold hydrolase [Pseudomonadota bacterium]
MLPIVVVPGIMGTRLENSSGRTLWDPDDGVSFSNVRGVSDLIDPTNRAYPSRRTGLGLMTQFQLRGVENVSHLVWHLGYKHLIEGLVSPRFRDACGQPSKVYCSGYDWRQSNRRSAANLSRVIRFALSDSGAPRVNIIAHSMGGLVARWLCRYGIIGGRPVRSKVNHLYLLGSPTHGAPKAYRALRQSFVAADLISDIAPEAFDDSVFDFAGPGVARMLRRFDSIFELLPNEAFCRANPYWLQFNYRRAGMTDAADPVRVYRNRVTGISTHSARLRNRDRFDRALGTYMPPNTTIFYSSDVNTRTVMRIDRGGRLRSAGTSAQNKGDGTVPTYSGAAFSASTPVRRRDLIRYTHSELANDPRAVRELLRVIKHDCQTTTASHSSTARAIAMG